MAVRELHITEAANSHSTLTLLLISKGHLAEADVLRYTDTPIGIYTSEGGCIYADVCMEIRLGRLNQYMEVSITAKSYSYQADLKAYSRTFQNPSKHLSEVVERVFASYGFAVS